MESEVKQKVLFRMLKSALTKKNVPDSLTPTADLRLDILEERLKEEAIL